jgi:hypothetical protein
MLHDGRHDPVLDNIAPGSLPLSSIPSSDDDQVRNETDIVDDGLKAVRVLGIPSTCLCNDLDGILRHDVRDLTFTTCAGYNTWISSISDDIGGESVQEHLRIL